jgi:hypothetical protein
MRTDKSHNNLKSKYTRTSIQAISWRVVARTWGSVLTNTTSAVTESSKSFHNSFVSLQYFIPCIVHWWLLSRNISITGTHLEKSGCSRAECVSLILHKLRYNYFVKLIVQRLNYAPDSWYDRTLHFVKGVRPFPCGIKFLLRRGSLNT